MRRSARVDNNQKEIVDVLRRQGASVLPLHFIGRGCPDLLVGFNERNILVEVKDGSKPPSARKLTEDQEKFRATWKGEIRVIMSVEEALALFDSSRRSPLSNGEGF